MKVLYVIFLRIFYLMTYVECQLKIKTSCLTSCIPLSECSSAHFQWVKYGKEPDICYFDRNYVPHICCPEQNDQKRASQQTDITTCSKNCVLLYECPSRAAENTTSCFVPDEPNAPHICSTQQNQKKCPIMSNDVVLEPQISYGYDADSENFEFMVALSWSIPFEKYYGCGGTLIHKLFVLTAAHCLYNRGSYTPLQYAIVGGGSLKNNQKAIRIVSVSQHPDYHPKSKYHDIAILKLEKEVSYQPACLPPPNYEIIPQTPVVAAGYGKTSFYGDISNRLMRADLRIYMLYNCSQYYGFLLNSQICALADPTFIENKSFPVYSDTCQGDSGGPLVRIESDSSIQSVIIGIVSFGFPCGNGYPGVFTKVSYYYDWIMQKISTRK